MLKVRMAHWIATSRLNEKSKRIECYLTKTPFPCHYAKIFNELSQRGLPYTLELSSVCKNFSVRSLRLDTPQGIFEKPSGNLVSYKAVVGDCSLTSFHFSGRLLKIPRVYHHRGRQHGTTAWRQLVRDLSSTGVCRCCSPEGWKRRTIRS